MIVIYFVLFVAVSSTSVGQSNEESSPMFSSSPVGSDLRFPHPFDIFKPFKGFPFGEFPFLKPTQFSSLLSSTEFVPWYKGPHVCPSVKVLTEPSSFTKEGFKDPSLKLISSSETCDGDNEKYVCNKRIRDESGSKFITTKFVCCAGYIRHPYGKPGCIKSPENSQITSTQDIPVQNASLPTRDEK